MKRRHRRDYILILPSAFTTGNLFCGFYSILKSIQGDFTSAAILVLIAGVFDVLDGRVARMTNCSSKFGVEYDSISDVVSFAMAPAIMAYLWALQPYGRLGVAASFFFAACGALRLARFNTIADELPKSYFLGLPSPAAALFIAAVAIAHTDVHFSRPDFILLPAAFILGLLMVSNVRYRSFKDFDLRHRRRFFFLVFLLIGLAFVIVRPEAAILVILSYYVGWGPVREGVSLLRRRGERKISIDRPPHSIECDTVKGP